MSEFSMEGSMNNKTNKKNLQMSWNYRQTRVLLYKRDKNKIILRLIIPLIFLILMF